MLLMQMQQAGQGPAVLPAVVLLMVLHLIRRRCVHVVCPLRPVYPGPHTLGPAAVPVQVVMQIVLLPSVVHQKMASVVALMAQLWHLDQHLIYVPEDLLLRYQGKDHGTGHAQVRMAVHLQAVAQIRHPIL